MNKKQRPDKMPVSFIVVDNRHLTKTGVLNIAAKSDRLYIATTNAKHPAFAVRADNMTVLSLNKKSDFGDLFTRLYKTFGIKRITVQTGGTLNAALVRGGYIDEVSVFIAPVLVGGKDTPTLIDGDSIKSIKELARIKPLELISATPLNGHYVHLRYRVSN